MRFPIPRNSLAAALGLAGAALAQSAALSVAPNPAPAGRAFTLTLSGLAGLSCNTVFERESVSVNGSRIDLRYTPAVSGWVLDSVRASPSDPVCALARAAAAMDLPRFEMPALAAGRYEVWAAQVPACLSGIPACTLAMPAPVSAGILHVGNGAAPGYVLNPAAANAGAPFDLQLLAAGYDCGSRFDSLGVAVSGAVITLAYHEYELPTGCAGAYELYGPTFPVPALAAGTYTVKANRLSQGAVEDAGVLTVNAKPHRDWYLKERAVQAEKAFAMRLLRDDVGNCGNAFTHQTATVTERGVFARFVWETDPGAVCIVDLRPYGPSFDLPGLKAGVYPVFPVQLQPCQVAEPACLLPVADPVATDTLVAAQTLALSMSEWRARAVGVEWRGGTAVFSLPAGPGGRWLAERLALDGRVLSRAEVAGIGGARVAAALGRGNGPGLLRLTDPAGTRRLLPMAP
jgi:hypothetical protein